MKTTQIAAVLAGVALALAGCGGSDDADTSTEVDSPCEVVFAEAAQVPDGQDTQADLHPAFEECADAAEFAAASEKYPEVLDGVDPAIWISNQCDYEPAVAGTPVCESAGS